VSGEIAGGPPVSAVTVIKELGLSGLYKVSTFYVFFPTIFSSNVV